MSRPTDKPYYRCPVEIKHNEAGDLEFHVTRRDGQVEVFPGPPGVTQITSNIEVFQPEGSDDVEIIFVSQ